MRFSFLFFGILLMSCMEAQAECPCKETDSKIPAESLVTFIGTVVDSLGKHPGWAYPGVRVRIDKALSVPQRTTVAIDVLKDEVLCKELEEYLAGDFLTKECTQEKKGVAIYMCPEDSPSKSKYKENCRNTIKKHDFDRKTVVIDSAMKNSACSSDLKKGSRYLIRARRYQLSQMGTGVVKGDILERWSTSTCYGTKIIS